MTPDALQPLVELRRLRERRAETALRQAADAAAEAERAAETAAGDKARQAALWQREEEAAYARLIGGLRPSRDLRRLGLRFAQWHVQSLALDRKLAESAARRDAAGQEVARRRAALRPATRAAEAAGELLGKLRAAAGGDELRREELDAEEACCR